MKKSRTEETLGLSRRAFLRAGGALAAFVATTTGFLFSPKASSQTASAGIPLPDEAVETTLKRLFGNRPLNAGEGRIRLELPLIAEDGSNVAVTVEASLPLSGVAEGKNIYIVADKNRRPLLAKFSFTPDAGKTFIATSIRLATTTDVRAVAEMSDRTLYAVSRNVRVIVGGCDLPPAG